MVCYVRLYAGPGTSGDIFIHDDDEDDELPFDDGDDAEFDEQKAASEEELWDRFNQVDFKPEPKPEPKKK